MDCIWFSAMSLLHSGKPWPQWIASLDMDTEWHAPNLHAPTEFAAHIYAMNWAWFGPNHLLYLLILLLQMRSALSSNARRNSATRDACRPGVMAVLLLCRRPPEKIQIANANRIKKRPDRVELTRWATPIDHWHFIFSKNVKDQQNACGWLDLASKSSQHIYSSSKAMRNDVCVYFVPVWFVTTRVYYTNECYAEKTNVKNTLFNQKKK